MNGIKCAIIICELKLQHMLKEKNIIKITKMFVFNQKSRQNQ